VPLAGSAATSQGSYGSLSAGSETGRHADGCLDQTPIAGGCDAATIPPTPERGTHGFATGFPHASRAGGGSTPAEVAGANDAFVGAIIACDRAGGCGCRTPAAHGDGSGFPQASSGSDGASGADGNGDGAGAPHADHASKGAGGWDDAAASLSSASAHASVTSDGAGTVGSLPCSKSPVASDASDDVLGGVSAAGGHGGGGGTTVARGRSQDKADGVQSASMGTVETGIASSSALSPMSRKTAAICNATGG
jgi:hypothetical protein